MNESTIPHFLPSIIVTSTALIVMLFSAVKREHRYTSLLTSLGLLIAFITQVMRIEHASHQTALFIFDGTSTLLSALLLFIGFVLSLLIHEWLERIRDPKEEYYMLFLLAIQGALIVCASSHFASFFMGLELMSLSLVPMIAYVDKQPKALEAGIKYLVLSAIASAFMLMAIAIIYFYTGTLSISEIVPQLPQSRSIENNHHLIYSTAIILLLVGFAFKLSLAPCHLWVADLFEGSPLPTAALLATLSKATVFIVLIRLFSFGEWHDQPGIVVIISAVAAASMIIGNLLALLQRNILRLLAFSSIAHFGYLLLAILSLRTEFSLSHFGSLAQEAALYYLVAYLVTIAGTFSLLILLDNGRDGGPINIEHLRGLFWVHPAAASILALLFLSLAGIPLTIGFVGKFYLTLAAVNAQLWWLIAALIIGSVASLFYYLRIILMMVERLDDDRCPVEIKQSIVGNTILGTTMVMVMGIGVFPGRLAQLIKLVVG